MSEESVEQKPNSDVEAAGYVNVSARLLSPIEVNRWSGQIRTAVFSALPERDRNEQHLNWMLGLFSQGRLQVWGMFSLDAERPRLVGIMTTMVNFYPPDRKILFIYTIYVPDKITRIGMAKALDCMVSYAKEKQCSGIEAVTKNPAVVSLCGDLGFDTEARLVRMEVTANG